MNLGRITWNIIICVFPSFSRLRRKCKIYGNSPTAIYHSISSSSRMFSLFNKYVLLDIKRMEAYWMYFRNSRVMYLYFWCVYICELYIAFSKCDFDDLSKMNEGLGWFCTSYIRKTLLKVLIYGKISSWSWRIFMNFKVVFFLF